MVRISAALVLAGLSLSCGGGGGSPTNPSNPNNPGSPAGSCRSYASRYSYVTSAPGSLANTTATCTFNAAARTLTCTFAQTNNTSTCTIDFLWRDAYNSAADFVNESKVVGKFLLTSRAQEWVTTPTSCGPPSVPGNTTYTYDANQRQLQQAAVNMTGAGSSATYVYSAWDAQGRPTAGTLTVQGGLNFPVTVAYDDSARTITISAGPGGAANAVNVITLDADGNLVRVTGQTSGFVSDSVYTITARQTVCQ